MTTLRCPVCNYFHAAHNDVSGSRFTVKCKSCKATVEWSFNGQWQVEIVKRATAPPGPHERK